MPALRHLPTSSSQSKLPKWAKVYKADQEEVEAVATSKSEYLLRIDSVKQWQSRIYQAQQNAWKDCLAPILKDYQEWTCRNTDREAVEEPPAKKPRHEASPTLSDLELLYTLEAPKPQEYPLELLPCFQITPPPNCRKDRHIISQVLVESLTSSLVSSSSHRRPCPIWIPHFQIESLHLLLTIVLRQCWEQEPSWNLKNTIRKQQQQRKQRSTSLQQIIMGWANQTQHFDELVFVIEVRTVYHHYRISLLLLYISPFQFFFSFRIPVDLQNDRFDMNFINCC